MLLGFVAMAALLIALGSFLFWIYPAVIANVQGNSMTGLVMVVALFFSFWVLMHTMVSHLGALSVQLPDEALAWAGRAVGTSMGRDAESHNRAMFLTVGRFGQSAVTGLRKKGGFGDDDDGISGTGGRRRQIEAGRGTGGTTGGGGQPR